MEYNKQPYDASLKSLLQEQAPEVLPYLVEGSQYLSELNTDVFKPQATLRADKAFLVLYEQIEHVFHMEIETRGGNDMSLRMLIYHTLLYTTYRKPVISLILYPFRTHLPSPPLVEVSAGREALKFWYHVLPLWEIHAQPFLEEHITAMYPLLPTMKGVTAEMMFQAIKEMAQVYNRDDLSRRLGWLDTLMQRADMLPSIEKQTVKEYLEMFNQQSELDDLLEESTFLRKFSDRAVGKATIQEMQRAVMDVLQARFPALTDFAQEKVFQISQTEVLHFLVSRVAIAPNEDAIRLLLSNPVA